MIDEIQLGKFINKLRVEAGLTQDELAKKIGVSSGKIVSKWETGNNIPDFMTLKKLSIALNVTLYELSECKRIKKRKFIEKTKDFIKSSVDIFKLNILCKVTIVITILLGIFFGLCTVFTIDNYGTVEIYNIESLDENFYIKGNIILTNNYNIFNLIDIDYIGENNKDLNINVYNIEYKVINNSNYTIITHQKRNMTNKKEINLLERINDTHFSIIFNKPSKKEALINDNDTLLLQISYNDKMKNIHYIEILFKTVNKYQNIF